MGLIMGLNYAYIFPGVGKNDRGQLCVQLQWHKKIVAKDLPMSPSPVEMDPADVSTGILEIKVLACRRLMATSGNKDDPFVSIDIGGKHELHTSAVPEHSYVSRNDEF